MHTSGSEVVKWCWVTKLSMCCVFVVGFLLVICVALDQCNASPFSNFQAEKLFGQVVFDKRQEYRP